MRLAVALSIMFAATPASAEGRREPLEPSVPVTWLDEPAINATPHSVETGWWAAPLRSLRGRFRLGDHAARAYSTEHRPRDIVGSLALACEGHQGESCMTTIGWTDLESAVGYGEQLVADVLVRGAIDAHEKRLTLERAFVRASRFGATVEVGRDAFAIGPSARTQLSWGTNAPPLDQLRVSTTRPIALSDDIRVSAHYIVGRLRSPQRYPGSLVSITRGQVGLGSATFIGLTQLLELGGNGAPELGLVDFLLEHVHRSNPSAGATDSSNRRFGADLSFRIHELQDARFYYAIMFEDIRRARLIDAIRYDADHLFGIAVGGITIEWYQTGIRSQEHRPRTSGFTSGGFAVGAPLGPDAESLYAGARLDLGKFTMYPWLELARLSSDTYEFIVEGPINRTSIGEDEARYRFGMRVRVPIRDNLWVEGEATFEHVDDFAFETGVTRNNGGITASIVWYPRGPLGRISLN